MKKLITLVGVVLALTGWQHVAADQTKTSDSAAVEIVRAEKPVVPAALKVEDSQGSITVTPQAGMTGIYTIEVVRDGVVVETRTVHNLIVKQGRRYLLDAGLDGSAGGYTLRSAWYVKLISDNITPDDAQTYAAPGTTEFTSYTGNRIQWNGVIDATAASITNSASKATFPITGSGTLYGAALVSYATKSDTGTASQWMISYALFGTPITVSNGDTVNVTITLTLT